MIIILHGEDQFRMQLVESTYLAKFGKDKKPLVRNFEINDAKTLDDAVEFMEAETLFAERRGATAKVTGWNAEMSSAFQKRSSWIASNADRLLIFRWANRSRPPHYTVEEFSMLTGKELRDWIREAASSLGNTLSASAMSAILTLHGSNTEGIWHDLITLSCWKPDSKIEEKDLALFHTELPKPEAFALVDTMMEGNKKQGFAVLEYALANGQEPHMILGGLVNLYRALIVASDATRNDSAAVKQFFAGRHPYWVSRITKNAARFTHDELHRQFRRLYHADIAIKTGKMDAAMALERAIIGL